MGDFVTVTIIVGAAIAALLFWIGDGFARYDDDEDIDKH